MGNMKIRTFIQELISALDSDTRWSMRNGSPDILVAGEDSGYIKAMTRKARGLGFHVEPADGQNLSTRCYGLVVDIEQVEPPEKIDPEHDPDNLCNPGMSCCAEAVFRVLQFGGWVPSGDKVLIVGRGHAVKELAERLEMEGGPVTIAHSGTENMVELMRQADILVNSAPALSDDVLRARPALCVDVSGAMNGTKGIMVIHAHEIGAMNISILLNRIATGRR